MPNADDIRGMFFEECDDLMEALFEGLNLLENDEAEDDTVNAIFRSVHSIKGGAGAFKLDDLVSFAHKFETVLDELRAERINADAPLIAVMFGAADHLAHLIEACRDDGEIDLDRGTALLSDLDGYISADNSPGDDFVFEPMALDFGELEAAPPPDDVVGIQFQPFAKLYQNGHDPLLLIAALKARGTLEVAVDHAALPSLSDYNPDDPKLVFSMTFSAQDAELVVEEVFEFVEGICRLEVTPIISDDPPPPGDFNDFETTIDAPADDHDVPTDLPDFEPEAEQTIAPAPQPDAPPAKPAAEAKSGKSSGKGESTAAQPTLRVELDKVDRLINTVGELIINQAMIAQRIDQLELPGDSDLEADMTDYKMLARDLQEGVMSIRAQPVKTLFQRMARITREAGSATGKSVRMNMIGESTEVDKTVIERLADPLTHMIRNAVDHGLESKEKRIESGKPETGEISLSASHSSGNVKIDVADDGAGLNRERILDIAITKGLIPKDSDLPDAEIDKLLFLQGFSTNDEVSELSGRGVGMDVVKRGVEALGGRISIASTPGKGTKFSIVLPLTLAVMDGIVISVARETMIVPITAVIETLRPEAVDVHHIGKDQKMLMIRGEYVPIVSVRARLGMTDPIQEADEKVLVLVEGSDHKRCALCVDGIQDQRQVVIKAVGGNYGHIPGVSAATIMGNGQIALILDTDHLSTTDDAHLAMPVSPAERGLIAP